MCDYVKFVVSRTASKILGLHPDTLRKLDKIHQIQTIRTPGGKRLYNVSSYIAGNVSFKNSSPLEKIKICYCRVSSQNQKDDLQRQVEYMQEKYPTHTIIKDIGSGLNFKRKGIQTILELAHKERIAEIVVAYKDRLCRFGFELFEFILQNQSNAKIVVLNSNNISKEEEVVQDILQIITVFSARVNGLRKYLNQIKKDKIISKQITEKIVD